MFGEHVVPNYPWPAGTVVWLKSGGPAMTVSDMQDQSTPDLRRVHWFAHGDHHSDTFHRDCLTLKPPKMITHYYG